MMNTPTRSQVEASIRYARRLLTQAERAVSAHSSDDMLEAAAELIHTGNQLTSLATGRAD